jgi:restriction system protein
MLSTTGEESMAVWIVRAGKYGEQEATALKEGLVTVAWNDLGDLEAITQQAKQDEDGARQALKKLYADARPALSKDAIAVGSGQVWAFVQDDACHRDRAGDGRLRVHKSVWD